jgi:hypothetical protein
MNIDYAGLTRVSIDLSQKILSEQTDCRVKPANDG